MLRTVQLDSESTWRRRTVKQYSADRIRNVGLFAHGGAGKTSLAEALLFDSKATTRLGRVDEGNTVTDYDPDEIKRRISVSLAVAPVEWRDTKINIIDAPGYADFIGEVKSALRVCDAAIIVVDASALLAIVYDEPEAADFLQIVAENDCIVAAPGRVEATCNIQRKATPEHMADLMQLLALPNVAVADFTAAHAVVAQEAFARYGKGRHRAALNFGDCMAYALAKVEGQPLLSLDEAFAATDVELVPLGR